MKKILVIVLMAATLVFPVLAADTVSVNPSSPGAVLSSGTGTNFIQNWPSAIGSNVVVAASVNWMDVTNVTRIPVGSGNNMSLEFVGTLAGGTGGSGGNGVSSNIVVRIAYDDQQTSVTTTTNGVASRTPNLFTWNITPATFTGGTVTVDSITNFNSFANINGGSGALLSLAHGNFYVYDISYSVVTNASPYLTNYAIYANIK